MIRQHTESEQHPKPRQVAVAICMLHMTMQMKMKQHPEHLPAFMFRASPGGRSTDRAGHPGFRIEDLAAYNGIDLAEGDSRGG